MVSDVCMEEETVISLPGLTIYPEQRKIYRDRQEIPLTTKEYELLCLLAANRGRVLTYTQIYEKVWGSSPEGNERRRVLFYYEYDFNFYQIGEMEHCTASAVQKSVSVAREKVKAGGYS